MAPTTPTLRREVPTPAAEHYKLAIDTIRDYAIFLLDADGFILSWNPGAEALKGYRAEEAIGTHFSRFYTAEAIVRDWPATELRLAAEYGRFEDEGYRIRKDGTTFWANVIITALRDAEGGLVGYSKITRDMTARRAQEDALRRSEERFRLLLESVIDYAIFMLDERGNVASWNPGAERIKGYAANEIVGRHFSAFYPPDDIARKWPETELERAREFGRFEDEGYRLRKDGSRFWANVVITPLYDQTGRVRGYAKVTRDLTERRRVESLESDARRMNEFIAMLGHELRNPLAPIRNAVGILALKPGDPETVAWSASVIERQAAQLGRLVDDLLDVSRITRGAITIDREPQHLDELAHRAIESMRPQFEARSQSLSEKLEPGVVVSGDAVRLLQVISNLLQNATKYTPDGGHVEVELRADRDTAQLVVRDDGVGMTPELASRAFDLFTQGASEIAQRESGLGLGLTIVERLVQLHGGEVRARSDGPGLGSEFVVELPLLREQPKPVATDGSGARTQAAHALRILVVDDNEDSARSMAMLLELEGHRVDVVHHGDEVMAQLRRHRHDVALLDIGLPGKTGYELAKEIRADAESEGMRLIAMTGYGTSEDRDRAHSAGFDEHFAKPVDLEALARLLAGYANARRALTPIAAP